MKNLNTMLKAALDVDVNAHIHIQDVSLSGMGDCFEAALVIRDHHYISGFGETVAIAMERLEQLATVTVKDSKKYKVDLINMALE